MILRAVLLLVAICALCTTAQNPHTERWQAVDQAAVANGSLPYNITGSYKGSWQTSEGFFGKFDKRIGDVAMRMLAVPTDDPNMIYIRGDLYIRNGVYNTPEMISQSMFGVMFWRESSIKLIALSQQSPVLRELSAKADNSSTLAREAINVFDNTSMLTTVYRSGECDYRLILRLDVHDGLAVQKSIMDVADERIEERLMTQFLTGTIYSSACKVNATIAVTSSDVARQVVKALHYLLPLAVVAMFQAHILLKQTNAARTQSTMAKISLLCIGMQTLMDTLLSMAHMTSSALWDEAYKGFVAVAFLIFLLCFVLEYPFLLTMWKDRRPRTNDSGWEGLRRDLAVLLTRIYASLLFTLLFAYHFGFFLHVLVLGLYAFWVPQIVHNVMRNTSNAFEPRYVIAMSITRLYIPLYIYGCPNNILFVEPRPFFCAFLVLFMAAQATVLLMQDKWGPRWIVPQFLRPKLYDYHATRSLTQTVDCVICMSEVGVDSAPEDFMTAPCGHVFHTPCLQRWLTIKLECPTCRRTLPPGEVDASDSV